MTRAKRERPPSFVMPLVGDFGMGMGTGGRGAMRELRRCGTGGTATGVALDVDVGELPALE